MSFWDNKRPHYKLLTLEFIIIKNTTYKMIAKINCSCIIHNICK